MTEEMKISIAHDFTMWPGARTYNDGKYSGQEFFDTILSPKFKEALERDQILTIDLDGTEGYASSFLNEAFRKLGKTFGPDNVWTHIQLISNEIPKYIPKIKEFIYED